MKRSRKELTEGIARIPWKIVTSFMILTYAIVLAVIKERMDAKICIIAVMFCFLGDIALNNKTKHSEQTSKDFIYGLVMFAVAHVFYAITYAVKVDYFFPQILINPIIWILFFGLDIVLFLFIGKITNEKMKIDKKYERFILVYSLIIVTDFTMVLFYAILERSINSIAVFGILFLIISDFLIAFEKFAKVKSKLIRKMVWIFYILGQLVAIYFA